MKAPDILILDEATSALDAESESLVNQALASLLASNNTTISIAHRLSTIKRSDLIICIGSDGRVAETGTYRDLVARPDGVFSKLMEWQLSGTEQPPRATHGPTVTEEEELAYRVDENEDEHEGDGAVEQEAEKTRGENVTKSEVVIERVKDQGA